MDGCALVDESHALAYERWIHCALVGERERKRRRELTDASPACCTCWYRYVCACVCVGVCARARVDVGRRLAAVCHTATVREQIPGPRRKGAAANTPKGG